nr:immunoglobulin heavy chain junction region [Mus musculus]MBK4189990.1 immunoglobulin heavy chain junction region [Mus musculus]MBK4189991.1 immunoglobulin heavy chain junction region [Mus musculus]
CAFLYYYGSSYYFDYW